MGVEAGIGVSRFKPTQNPMDASMYNCATGGAFNVSIFAPIEVAMPDFSGAPFSRIYHKRSLMLSPARLGMFRRSDKYPRNESGHDN
jgi:hypothetical protein